MTQEEKMILRETTNLLKSEKLLRTPPSEMQDEEALSAWSVLDLIDKEVVAARKDELRQHLLQLVEEKGILNGKGHFEYSPPKSDGQITKQKRAGKVKLNHELLIAVLTSRGFDIDKIMTKVIDEDRVEAFVALGEITMSEIKTCSNESDPTYALIVKKPSEVLALMPKTLKGKKS